MKINLPQIFTQVGDQTPIGDSTIDQIGCLTVDAAEVACYFGHSETPSSLAQKVTYAGDLWVWSELSKLYGDIAYAHPVQSSDIVGDLSDSQMNEIRGTIDQGYPVFIKIITPKTPGGHWLLGVDYNGDDIQIADPLTGTIHPITDYGVAPKTAIYAYGWYAGPLPQQNQTNALAECLRQHDDLVTKCDQKDETISHLSDTINQKNADIASLQATVSGLQSQVLTLQDQVNTLTEQAKKVPDLTQQLQDVTDSRTGYMQQVSALQTQLGASQKGLLPKNPYLLKIYNFLISLDSSFNGKS